MSDTPRTDAAECFIDCDRGIIDSGLGRQLERELNAAQATIRQQQLLDEEIMRLRERMKRFERITDGFRREQNDIEQTCGKALGYPRFCDDQKNFPGSTEADGVIIGDHVAASIAAELANKYAAAIERVKRLEEAGDVLQSAVVGVEGMTHWQWLAAAHEADLRWRKAKEAKP